MQIATENGTPSSCSEATKGVVNLDMAGNPGDAFRIYLRCGDEMAAKCTARISSGATTASCQDGPNKFMTGEYHCTAKPSVGNSPAAKITSAACE